jgi:hypothetical protein
MEILESQPGLGAAHRLGVQAATRNRIENRTESDRERSVGAFDAVSSNPHSAHQGFPYAIPLPHRGEGTVGHASSPPRQCACGTCMDVPMPKRLCGDDNREFCDLIDSIPLVGQHWQRMELDALVVQLLGVLE